MDSRRHGLARVLSKRGICSRTQAAHWVREGRVRLNGRIVRDPEFPTLIATAVIELDYPDMRAHDHMSLVKFADGWRIVVKAYDAFTPARTQAGAQETGHAR